MVNTAWREFRILFINRNYTQSYLKHEFWNCCCCWKTYFANKLWCSYKEHEPNLNPCSHMLDSVPDNYQFVAKTNTGVSNSVSGGPQPSLRIGRFFFLVLSKNKMYYFFFFTPQKSKLNILSHFASQINVYWFKVFVMENKTKVREYFLQCMNKLWCCHDKD